MASLINVLRSSCLKGNAQLTQIFRREFGGTCKTLAAWNKDWKPAPYPQTPEQRAAAAARYGLKPEDYQPYNPDKDPGYGDYPNMKWVGKDGRDPYDFLEYPTLGYDYGQPMHRYAIYSTGDRFDPSWQEKAYYTQNQMIGIFLSVVGGGFLLHCLCKRYGLMIHMPVMPKQYPDNLWAQRGRDVDNKPNFVHYTFEAAE